ncbi:alpha/beta fold hydrolase [Colwellia sp. MEBiC06753]
MGQDYKNFKENTDNWYEQCESFQWRQSVIKYRKMGNGPVLLMVHGYPTAGVDWMDIADELQETFTIVAPDIADAGQSENPTHRVYTLHEHADMIEELMAELCIDEVHLVGHDVGDSICQELIARQNAKALSFAIHSCVFFNGGIIMAAHRPRDVQVALAGPNGSEVARQLAPPQFYQAIKDIMGTEKPPEEALEVIWQVSKSVNGVESLARRSHNMLDRHQHTGRWVKALKDTKLPMIMINGTEDPISGNHACDVIAETLPHMKLIRLPEIGHFPIIEAPQLCVKAMTDFYRELSVLPV